MNATYTSYRKAAKDLARLIDALTSSHKTVDTLGNIEGLPKGVRLHINKSSGKTVVTLWGEEAGKEVTL